MSNVSKKKSSLPTVQQPAARWAFVLAVCASLGVVVSYYWRVFYGLDARGVSAAGAPRQHPPPPANEGRAPRRGAPRHQPPQRRPARDGGAGRPGVRPP